VFAALQERASPLAPIGGIPSEWIIASLILGLWVGIFILFGRQQRRFSKQRNREIAEKLVASTPSALQRVPTEASGVAGLRLDELQQLTTEFERLGFVRVGDYRITFANDELTRGFFRLFHIKRNIVSRTSASFVRLWKPERVRFFMGSAVRWKKPGELARAIASRPLSITSGGCRSFFK